MSRYRGLLAVVAVLAWTAAAAAHLIATLAPSESDRIEWGERRNLFALCGSLSTNALVLVTGYRYLSRRLSNE